MVASAVVVKRRRIVDLYFLSRGDEVKVKMTRSRLFYFDFGIS
jgi:hypothetical protein